MKFNPDIHHRTSIRLKNYDYSQNGAYFITICTHERKIIFSEIINKHSELNPLGKIVENEWLLTSEIRKNIVLDEYIIMPNHLHGIVITENDEERGRMIEVRGRMQYAPTTTQPPSNYSLTQNENDKLICSPSQTIGSIIRGFKSSVTRKINQQNNVSGIPVWQRNYYERIIRNGNELDNIRDYIKNNPLKWANDKLNPFSNKNFK